MSTVIGTYSTGNSIMIVITIEIGFIAILLHSLSFMAIIIYAIHLVNITFNWKIIVKLKFGFLSVHIQRLFQQRIYVKLESHPDSDTETS